MPCTFLQLLQDIIYIYYIYYKDIKNSLSKNKFDKNPKTAKDEIHSTADAAQTELTATIKKLQASEWGLMEATAPGAKI